MAEPGVLLSRSAFERVRDVVHYVEQSLAPGEAAPGRGDGGGGQNVQFVKCTSVTPTSGMYPATLQTLKGDGQTFTTGAVCWLAFANTTTPVLNRRYGCKLAGVRASDKRLIFEALASDASGGSGTSPDVTSSALGNPPALSAGVSVADFVHLYVNYTTGLAIENGGASEALLHLLYATDARAGGVSTASQSFAGAKTFTQNIVVGTSTGSNDEHITFTAISSNTASVGFAGTLSTGTAPYHLTLRSYDNTSARTAKLQLDPSGSKLVLQLSSGTPIYAIRDGGGTTHGGQTVVINYKNHASADKTMTFTGGILTAYTE